MLFCLVILYLLLNGEFYQFFSDDRFGPAQPQFVIPWMLMAFILGLAQIRIEKRPDQWSFYVHRPITLQKLLLAKWGAAFLLSCLFMLPVLVGFSSLFQNDQYDYPKNSYYVYRMIRIWLLAVPIYLLGMYFGLRRSWTNVPLLIMVIVTYASFDLTEISEQFFRYFAILGGLSFLLMGMVFTQFQIPFRPKRIGWVTLVEAYCTTGVVFLIYFFLFSLSQALFPSETYDQHYLLNKEGDIFLGGPNNTPQLVRARDNPQGLSQSNRSNPTNQSKQSNASHSNFREWVKTELYLHYFVRLLQAYHPYSKHNPESGWEDSSGNFRWYYSPEDRLLRGYHRDSTGSFVGFFGPDGFIPPGAEITTRFSKHPIFFGDALVFLEGHVLSIDFENRTTSVLRKFESDNPVLAVKQSPHTPQINPRFPLEWDSSRPYVTLERRHSIEIYQASNAQDFVQKVQQSPLLTLPVDANKEYALFVSELSNKKEYVVLMETIGQHKSSENVAVFYFNHQGELVESIELPPILSGSNPPIISLGGLATYAALSVFLKPEAQLAPFLDLDFFEWMHNAFLFLLAGTGVLVYLRYQVPRNELIGWVLFAGVMGLCGMVAVWLIVKRPPQIVCPSCGKKGPLREAGCRFCASEQVGLVLDGFETR